LTSALIEQTQHKDSSADKIILYALNEAIPWCRWCPM